ncbi:MAG: ACP S-malonyltransferase [Magnetovibrio sp.]|nr:ACP S-malonyltransferase [Magnetovibrio sp.]
MTRALVFPGQGSQAVGMGKALYDAFPAAKAIFDEVDDALGEKLSDTIFNGPEDQLTLTANTQPALMAVSLATFAVLKDKGFDLASQAAYVAGHSLGEYSALAAAGTFTVGDAAKLLRTRGSAMQAAVPVGEGAMAALLGLDWDTAAAAAAEAATDTEVCQCANDNADGQVVISGSKAAVERAAEIAKEKGAKRAVMLPVSAPFHCSLMQPAADAMEKALAAASMSAPVVPVIANVTTEPTTDPDEIRKLLVQQVTGTVRWRETIAQFEQLGVDQIVEVGAGKVLSGLVRRNKAIEGSNIGGPEDIEAFLASL